MKSQIEILLGEWGRWKRGENRTGLGYPSRSAFQQMRVDGDRGVEVEVALIDDDLRRVADEVELLHPDYRAILTAHYVAPGPVKTKADRLSTSVRVYYSTLEHAHRVLSHAMGGRYRTGYEPKLCAHIAGACAQI